MRNFEGHKQHTEKTPESPSNPELRRALLELKLKEAIENALRVDQEA